MPAPLICLVMLTGNPEITTGAENVSFTLLVSLAMVATTPWLMPLWDAVNWLAVNVGGDTDDGSWVASKKEPGDTTDGIARGLPDRKGRGRTASGQAWTPWAS